MESGGLYALAPLLAARSSYSPEFDADYGNTELLASFGFGQHLVVGGLWGSNFRNSKAIIKLDEIHHAACY